MQIPQNNILFDFANTLYPELKFWGFYGGILWAAFKAVSWLKAIKTNDLHHIQLGIDRIGTDIVQLGTQFHSAVDRQSEMVVKSFESLRGDIQSLTVALIAQSPKHKRGE
jgi:hypothetical protein